MYSQDVPHQILFKSVDVLQSYSKNKNVPSFFETQEYVQLTA